MQEFHLYHNKMTCDINECLYRPVELLSINISLFVLNSALQVETLTLQQMKNYRQAEHLMLKKSLSVYLWKHFVHFSDQPL